MKFEEAVARCHVRSAIYRTGDPYRIMTEADIEAMHPDLREINRNRIGNKEKKLYWKNHNIPLAQRVPGDDQLFDDWEEYDPREDDDGSLFMFND